MSIFRNDTLGSWTRGGQAIVHNVRMTTQVFYQTCLAGLVIWIGGIVWYALEKSSDYERFVLVKIGQATFMRDAVPGNVTPILFRTPTGQQYWTTPKALLDSRLAHKTLAAFESYLLHGAALSGVFALAMLLWAWFYFTRTGRGLGSNQFLRGARFGTVRQLKRALLWQKKGPLTIGGVPVPEAFEPEHILLCGAPGTGKTNLIVKMLEGIRTSGRRAIVYDTAGTFVEKFYRPKYDTLLNPLDQRTARWSPWVDVPRDYHYDQIAESTIPDKGGDPFWAKAARGTLVAVLRKLARQKHTYVSLLLDRLLRSKLKDLVAFAAGTDAAAFLSMEGDRTSAGIQAELASVMRSFSYLDDTEDGFSIRDWVEKGEPGSWLFITVKADQLPSLRPLITVWLDIAISAIMSLMPDRDRRLYCVIDELPTLQKLPSLSDFLARARKYGGCGILGYQSYPQLEATYGIQDAAAITGYCSTWVALRANDTPTAKHVSENLGQVEQVEANEGMSYGVNDMRDGVNLSRIQVTRPLVMHTEVTNLPNLSGFLRFGRNLPVVKFADRYNVVSSDEPAFVERVGPPERLSKADELVKLAKAEARVREALERERGQGDDLRPPAKEGQGSSASATGAPSVDGSPAVESEAAQVDAILGAEQGKLPIPPRDAWTLLAARQGSIQSNLVQHGRADGPREQARPA
ncbi:MULTISPECIES: type IV secretion system DNA-binding domain-containing protein [Sphingobium]|uniref:type IV secretion system DNA-binding domain-containing protein n=1 Tax=Sphingobium TaxID=165695 RepID=UPI000770439F|nr:MULTISPECIES: type IV secretion system DNA-binding domain-containing protein [unclassified Sphingobium]AMK25775.1 VirD4/TraD-like protein [Sphingobium sp. TKS]MEC6700854.1 type IV secretion system DNA-binding domain-containing protein [Sphingobium sp. SJ10-10]NML87754.1 type IV secretion system DNA-binding domain-containing protein [Sphingobium sp. TB-6]PNQ04359.1 conjugal transfer protein TraD [Sphingobium sp. SA916]